MQGFKKRGFGSGGDGATAPYTRFIEGLASEMGFPNAAKLLVEPGKDALELIMRTVLKDENEANDAVMFYHKLKKFDLLSEYLETLLAWLASRVAIKGLARLDFLQANVGILAPQLRTGYGPKAAEKEKVKRDNKQEEQ